MRLRRFRVSGLLLLMVAACGGSGLSGDEREGHAVGVQPLLETEYIGRRAAAECAFMERCCLAARVRPANRDCEPSANVATAQARPNADGGARFQGDRAAACIAALEHAACVPAKLFHFPDECNDVYERGHIALGESCASTADCAMAGDEMTACIVAGEDASGLRHVCGLRKQLDEGEPCVDSEPGVERVCGAQLWCNDTSGVCERSSGVGGACASGPLDADTCGVGALCERVLCAERRGTQCLGRCIAPRPVGSACEAPGDCEGWACIGGICRDPLVWVSGSECVP